MSFCCVEVIRDIPRPPGPPPEIRMRLQTFPREQPRAVLTVGVEAPSVLHVLIVEDDPLIHRVCSEMCMDRGWRVQVSESVETAQMFLHERTFDLVLLDLGLPDGTGLELLGHLKQNQ